MYQQAVCVYDSNSSTVLLAVATCAASWHRELLPCSPLRMVDNVKLHTHLHCLHVAMQVAWSTTILHHPIVCALPYPCCMIVVCLRHRCCSGMICGTAVDQTPPTTPDPPTWCSSALSPWCGRTRRSLLAWLCPCQMHSSVDVQGFAQLRACVIELSAIQLHR